MQMEVTGRYLRFTCSEVCSSALLNFCRRQFLSSPRTRKNRFPSRWVSHLPWVAAQTWLGGDRGVVMTTGPSTGEIAMRPRGQSSANVIIALLVGSAFVMILNETIMSVALPAL